MNRQQCETTYPHGYPHGMVSGQDGVVLVTALLIMVILTIMGVAALTIRNTEQSITLNSEVFQHNFYSMESVALESADSLEKLNDATLMDPTLYPAWLRLASAGVDLTQSSQWPSGSIIPANTALSGAFTNITPPGYSSTGTAAGDRIWYAGIDQGIAPGSSMTYGPGGVTAQERLFDLYGMYDVKPGAGKAYHGKMMLALGYKRVVYGN